MNPPEKNQRRKDKISRRMPMRGEEAPSGTKVLPLHAYQKKPNRPKFKKKGKPLGPRGKSLIKRRGRVPTLPP